MISEPEEDIDSKILDSIQKEFKSCKEIAEEINSTAHRVYIRMHKLQIRHLVYSMQAQTEGRGVKPIKYKSK